MRTLLERKNSLLPNGHEPRAEDNEKHQLDEAKECKTAAEEYGFFFYPIRSVLIPHDEVVPNRPEADDGSDCGMQHLQCM